MRSFVTRSAKDQSMCRQKNRCSVSKCCNSNMCCTCLACMSVCKDDSKAVCEGSANYFWFASKANFASTERKRDVNYEHTRSNTHAVQRAYMSI